MITADNLDCYIENSVKNRWYNAKTSAKRKEEKEREEEDARRSEIAARDEDERRSSTESTETVQSFIFKSEESEE